MFPRILFPLEKHDEIKTELLKRISEAQTFDGYEGPISRLDWTVSAEEKAPYWDLFWDSAKPQISKVLDTVYSKWELDNYWFQQYNKNDTHGWHWHDHTFFSCVYYLELPNEKYATEFYDPVKKIAFPSEAKEGDILLFASQWMHRSPPNLDDTRKTIISFNIS